ncbi:hypothetical protein AGMMS49992_25810 [Clostridia bacterium]|nr:hypothetical protein AGMMS49992_25810 [Clostridia bacterium]
MGMRPKFMTPESMEKAVQDYFDYQSSHHKLPTMTGLVRVLGFADRTSLRDYKAKDKFSHIIINARRVVEEHYEEALLGRDSFRGSQFALRINYGWTDPKDDSVSGTQVILVNDLHANDLVRKIADGSSTKAAVDGDSSIVL